MASPIGPLGLLADVVILVVLAAAVASRGLSPVARATLATLAFTCAWLLTAVLDALRAPGWTMFAGGGVIVVSILVITVTVHLWTQEGGGESGPGRRDNDGGGGPPRRRPDAPQRGNGGYEPSWWPEFERQVAFYIAEREREKQPAGLPAEPSRVAPDACEGLASHGVGAYRPRA